MLDVHPPHESVHTWRDFLIHIATIVVGLLIAIGLEQTVEALHHHHQRVQLDGDLRAEAESNQNVIERDLQMFDLEPWFQQAEVAASAAALNQGRVQLTLAPPPCIPGSVGTAAVRYFAPSEAVWTAAREGGLVALLPAEQSRMQARLAHNYLLLSAARDKVHEGCQLLIAMRERFATRDPHGADRWAMSQDQAEKFAAASADTRVAIQALLFRLRWSLIYEQGIAKGETKADIKMMSVDQTQFEDPQHP